MDFRETIACFPLTGTIAVSSHAMCSLKLTPICLVVGTTNKKVGMHEVEEFIPRSIIVLERTYLSSLWGPFLQQGQSCEAGTQSALVPLTCTPISVYMVSLSFGSCPALLPPPLPMNMPPCWPGSLSIYFRPYQCGHCSQSFSQPSELRNHVVTHSSDRPFKCGYCGRAFAGATTLNNHIRTHTGEKPFK